MKRDDHTTWIAEEDAGLRRRLSDLADEDPVDEAWETIQSRIVARPRSRPSRRPIVAATAAVAAVVVGALSLLPGHDDDSQVDTVDDKTTTSNPASPSTTDDSTPPTSASDSATPTSPGTTSDHRSTTTTPRASGSRNRPSASTPGTTASDTTTPDVTGPSTTIPPELRLSVSPSTITAGENATISSIDPCPRPAGADRVDTFIVIQRDQNWVLAASPDPDVDGMWSFVYESPSGVEPAVYEVDVGCYAAEPGEDFKETLLYEVKTLTITAP